jgi:hypothetical protein
MNYDIIYNKFRKSNSIDDIISEYNFNIEGQGNSRIVIRINNLEVLKISKKGGKKQNYYEIKQWEKNPDIRDYLANIKDYSEDYNWILMSRCLDVSEKEANNFYKKIQDKVVVKDDNKNNVGYDLEKEKNVLRDYGSEIICK